jgi:tetratricopeptide (TPR) repeat protein
MQPEGDATPPGSMVEQSTVDAITELLASRKYADAIPLLESATRQVPQDAEYADEAFKVWMTLGVAYRMTGRYDDAIDALTVAARNALPAEDESAAYLRRGIVWYYKGEPRVAVLDFEHAASASNNDPRPEFWKGLVLAKQGKYRQAITAYSSALRLYGGYTMARNNRGLAYLATGEVDFAVADFDEVIRQEPDNASAYYKRAIALGRRGDVREAVASYTDSIRLDGKFAPAYYNRGLLHRRLGNAQQADADLAKARELDPQVGARARPDRLARR